MDTFQLAINRKIDRWDEALPLGNGQIGCLMFGGSDKLILSLDRGDIWDSTNNIEKTTGFSYSNLKTLVEQKNTKKIAEIFDKPYNNPLPSKLPTGKIIFDIGNSANHSFQLNLKTAVARYNGDDGLYLETYVHAVDGYGMIKTNSKNAKYIISQPKFGKKTWMDPIFKYFKVRSAISSKLKKVKYPAPIFENFEQKNIQGQLFLQTITNGCCFGIAIGQLLGQEDAQFAYFAYIGDNQDSVLRMLKDKISLALERGYDDNLVRHQQWWAEYFNKSDVVLPDKFLELNYNIGNYLLGSGSRQGCYPMPIQGLWTACDDKKLPPWKGDYHHDLNTELMYASYLKANHLESGLSFVDYLTSLIPRAREFSKSFFDADGICLPSVMDIKGYALGGWPMYSLSPTNQLWLCQSFLRHYYYTGDMEFLRKTAYPFVSQSATFIASLLTKDLDGYYVLPLSSSPEIHDNRLASFLKPNSNYDQALIMYAFQAIYDISVIIGEDGSKWLEYLKFLRPLAVNKDNILMINPEELLTESHRHLSHAMSIYPLRLLDYSTDKDKQIIDATLAYTASLGTKYYTGYTFAWMACLYTVARNGDKALEYLEIFYKYFCSVNGFHLNGDYTKQGYSKLTYRPFTLEGNFCALDAIQEMLLYSDKGQIRVFPAIPSSWKDLEFNTLRAEGGILVSAKMIGGVIMTLEFLATKEDVTFSLLGDYTNYNITKDKEVSYANSKVKLAKGTKLSLSRIA